MYFEVSGSNYLAKTNRISFNIDQDGEPYLNIDLIHLREDAPEGLGAVMLWRMVRACATLQIGRMSLEAVGGRKYSSFQDGARLLGHYAWPRYGFEGSVQNGLDKPFFSYFPHFPRGMADGSVNSLLDLYASPGGRQFWLVGGDSRYLTFEVAPTSRSVLTLHKYLTDKGFL